MTPADRSRSSSYPSGMFDRFQVTFDAHDALSLATFWAVALDYIIQPPPQGFDSWDDFADSINMSQEERNAISAIVDPAGRGPGSFSSTCQKAKPPRIGFISTCMWRPVSRGPNTNGFATPRLLNYTQLALPILTLVPTMGLPGWSCKTPKATNSALPRRPRTGRRHPCLRRRTWSLPHI